MMCPHCRTMFLPIELEQHKELGCPQDPVEQVMSGVVSTGQQVGASHSTGVYSCEQPCTKSYPSRAALLKHQKLKSCRRGWTDARIQQEEEVQQQLKNEKLKLKQQTCDAKRKGTD